MRIVIVRHGLFAAFLHVTSYRNDDDHRHSAYLSCDLSYIFFSIGNIFISVAFQHETLYDSYLSAALFRLDKSLFPNDAIIADGYLQSV